MADLRVGPERGRASAAAILVHGRGGSPEDMLGLAGAVQARLDDGGSDLVWIAPRAPGGSWYPYGFMESIEANQPALDQSLGTVEATVEDVEGEGIPRSRIALIGFSQGACLATEYAVRNPARYGGIVALSGGLIGPPGTRWNASGSLDGTPAFLGCSDDDPHIPEVRVRDTAEHLAGLEADVTARIYPGMGHTVNEDEIAAVAAILTDMKETA